MSALNLKPQEPPTFEGKCDYLTVNMWLFQVEQYLFLIAVSNSEAKIDEDTKVVYQSSLLRDSAASWWYMPVQRNATPVSWDDFKDIVKAVVITADSARRAKCSITTDACVA